MTTLNALTSSQVLLAVVGAAVAIGALIALGRYWMNRNSENLSERYNEKEWKSPLKARTKYPEVDIFRYSSTLMLAGLAFSLFIIVSAMSWTTYEKEVYIPEIDMELETDVVVEPPRTATPPPPPPPPPPPVIEEVPDEMVIEDDDMEFMDQSIEAETVIDVPEVTEVTEKAAPPPPPPPPMEEEDEIFKVVEQMPRFPGCEDLGGSSDERKQCADKKLYEFIYKHIQYPILARENNIQGNVVLSFVVEKDGSIGDIAVLRDPGAGCGDEAARVIELINTKNIKWTPGKQRGKPVRVQFILPVRFALA